MRLSPTFGHIGWAVLGLALVGCATDNGDAEEEEVPAAEGPAREHKPKTTTQVGTKFEASIPADPKKQAEETDLDADPASVDAEQCIDNGDPGDSLSLATVLPETSDCDDDMKTVTGIMKGAADVDYYKLSALDHRLTCHKDTDFQAETPGTNLCVYLRCKNDTPNAVKGCKGGVLTRGDGGVMGCCAAAPAHTAPDFDCSGTNESADISLVVTQVGGDECLPYKVNYRF